MQIFERRRQANRASVRVRVERAKWLAETGHLRALGTRHRELLTVSGGFLGGVLAGRIPWRGFARIGSFVGAIASLALRSPLGVVLFEGMANAQNVDAQATNPSDS